MSWEQRNDDFCKAQTDAQMAYIEAEREADRLQTENDKLRELVRDYDKVLDDAVYVWGTVADFLGYGRKYDSLHNRMRELGIELGS